MAASLIARLYDLTKVGRIRMNRKLSISVDEEIATLTKEDILRRSNISLIYVSEVKVSLMILIILAIVACV